MKTWIEVVIPGVSMTSGSMGILFGKRGKSRKGKVEYLGKGGLK